MAKNFYFICARGTHGGPEAIHQIVDKINTTTEHTAFVTYFQKQFVKEDKFKHFHVNYIHIKEVKDVADNVICAPETHTYFLRRFKKAKKVIVWLSLYHYLRNLKEEAYTFRERCRYLYCKNRFPWPAYPLYYIRDLLENKHHFKFDMPDVFHTQNCEYIAEYLRENGVCEHQMVYLDGPVRAEYFQTEKKREKQDLIAYNPSKGAEEFAPQAVEAIKKIDPDLQFVPIQGMTVAQVKETLLNAKVYLDFGFFPGPEKLVKEAALCGCNIITADRGAAKNSRDIFIPQEYKFTMERSPYEEIAQLACDMVKNYEKYRSEFAPYIEKINALNNNFQRDIKVFTDHFE